MSDLLKYIRGHDHTLPALVQSHDKKVITYGELVKKVEDVSGYLRKFPDKHLVFLYTSDTVDSIVIYLACLDACFPVCLLEPSESNLRKLIEIYEPPVISLPEHILLPLNYKPETVDEISYKFCISETDSFWDFIPQKDLALLLQTSGSTGDPKLVRLTKKNIDSNANSIVSYLGTNKNERSIQGLPMQYSYGLSLINSHLFAGGVTVLTNHSFMRPEFWDEFNACSCTSFAGVPFMYETLHRIGFEPRNYPTLKTLTQAGGSLRSELVKYFCEKASLAGCRFFVMYGQTEATARISYVPHEKLKDKIGSIGIPIPGGHMELAPVPGIEKREIVYKGPNVMMGYAESKEDLKKGDELNGTLHTGDLAKIDSDGFFYIVGRLKRFVKLYGKRINLHEVETYIETSFPVLCAVTGNDKELNIFAEIGDNSNVDLLEVKNHIARYLSITPMAINIKKVDIIPITQSGKKDYKRLAL